MGVNVTKLIFTQFTRVKNSAAGSVSSYQSTDQISIKNTNNCGNRKNGVPPDWKLNLGMRPKIASIQEPKTFVWRFYALHEWESSRNVVTYHPPKLLLFLVNFQPFKIAPYSLLNYVKILLEYRFLPPPPPSGSNSTVERAPLVREPSSLCVNVAEISN